MGARLWERTQFAHGGGELDESGSESPHEKVLVSHTDLFDSGLVGAHGRRQQIHAADNNSVMVPASGPAARSQKGQGQTLISKASRPRRHQKQGPMPASASWAGVCQIG